MNTKLVLRLLSFSFGAYMVIVGSIFILSILQLTDPFLTLQELFSRYNLNGLYSYDKFGPIFKLWAISAFLLVSSLNLFTSPFSIMSLAPIIILLIISFFVGFLGGFKKGFLINMLILFWGTFFALILAFFLPLTLPTAGLTAEDQVLIQSLGTTSIKLSYLIPLNLLTEMLITIVLVIVSATIGVFIRSKFEYKRIKFKKKETFKNVNV
ncbi:MAG: hypothetical protein EAX86_07035 [Candidatus Heimdallarchaeota archaeon]|nr:hypothetical protein [Candidatus Heimdallarchaeota archaeon]